MPRLESLAAGGYFPTPPRIVAAIARHLAPAPTGGRAAIRILDPCAGTGAAVAHLAAALGAASYGVELNAGRAAEARALLDHAIAGDAFAIRCANRAFSALFANPPYDDTGDERQRQEHAFLTGLSRTLATGGLLILVVPQRRLDRSARYLASHYDGHAVFRFPDPEWAAFGQVVLFAHRREAARHDAAAETRLRSWASEALLPLPDAPADGKAPFRVPALPAGPVLFAGLAFDASAAAAEARRAGVWASPTLAEQLWPADERPIRPLMPLRRGHLAQLIAAGFLNNHVLEAGGDRFLVKGHTRKELIVVADDEERRIEREAIRTSVMYCDLRTGAIRAVGNGADGAVDRPA
jgi:predicted RNA methylase